MGDFWFAAIVATTVLVLAPARRGQVLALGLALGVTVLVGQGLLKHGVGKLRPDADERRDVQQEIEALGG